ncbi:MAG TPA: protease modulator HflK [Verrucomicrobiae bacterium]|nr:protease modulator HflK [Verrucomicrobiae bacterium]
MSDEHKHHHHARAHEHVAPTPPETPDDAGSQALSEALRSSFAIVKFVMVALVVVFLASGIFQVGNQEKAVVLRFGRTVGTGEQALLGPGLHWSFPYPIDEVVKIPFKEVQSVESTIGMFYMSQAQKAAYEATGNYPPGTGTLNPAVDGYVITADRNIIHTTATISYQVTDPIRAVFHFSEGANSPLDLSGVSNFVQNAANNALLYTAAHYGVDAALVTDPHGFEAAVIQRVIQLTDQENLGITINQDLSSVKSIPPRQLQDIFNQVTEAQQNRIQLLDAAHSAENQIINSADAQAAAIVYEAIAASSNYVANVQADAKRFSSLLPNYEVNPDLFKQMELVQTMGQVLTNVNFKALTPTTASGEPMELRLLLNREPPGANSGAAAGQ